MATGETREPGTPDPGVTQEHEPAMACPFSGWREDFPIRWDNDHYVTRRDLTRFLTLSSVLLAGGTAGMSAWGMLSRPGKLPELRVGVLSDVTPGSSLLFRYPTDEDPCILVREADGELRAYSQVCTHLSCAVVYRSDSNVLFCPCHQGYFNVEEGRPIQGPPTRPLPRVTLDVRGDEIYAVGMEV